MKSKGYTLWLMPKGASYDKFANLIKKFAKENIGPVFEPHVTLLGEIMFLEEEAVNRTQQLVLDQKQFQVTLQNIDYEDFYFRTLFIRAEITEPLLTLHNRAKEIFGIENIPWYMPHISLLYGTFPNDLKEKIIAEIGRDQTTAFDISSVHLIRGGEVKDWEIIKEFPF